MAERRSSRRVMRPATTPEGREDQLISLATDLAERQLREGTAPAQVVTHFLKAGGRRERLEQTRLQNENLLISAKVAAIESTQKIEVLYEEALVAMRSYQGQEVDLEEDYYDGD